MSITHQDVLSALSDIVEPWSGTEVSEFVAAVHLVHEGNVAKLTLTLGVPVYGLKQWLLGVLTQVFEGVDLNVVVELKIADRASDQLPGVKNLIAIASGKGGVGKSSTAVNLALALRSEGAKVGLMDADIYGPSIPKMVGIDSSQRPRVVGENRFAPIEVFGIQTLSMGNLMTDQTPAVWRGPMASGAFQQLLTQTLWHDLDYLIVDMPPGTGDIQLTLSQRAPVAGAVIVTTPQDIALADAIRGIEMFRKVDVPVLGVVENMATHICSSCGHVESIFGSGGGETLASDYSVSMLGSLPLDISIRESLDEGSPTVVNDPDGLIATEYKKIARRMTVNLALSETEKGPEIEL